MKQEKENGLSCWITLSFKGVRWRVCNILCSIIFLNAILVLFSFHVTTESNPNETYFYLEQFRFPVKRKDIILGLEIIDRRMQSGIHSSNI